MSKNHFGGESLSSVLHEESRDQVLRLGRDVAPLGVGELVLAVLKSIAIKKLLKKNLIMFI
jgi:hypothetical protein